MRLNLGWLTFETTRRCNLSCPGYCMRGPSQNIDLTTNVVDTVLDNNNINYIDRIIFSGGEPTLNPGIIIYTINKIIENNISVGTLEMVTNGQIYSPELVEAFNRFNEYRNERVRQSTPITFKDLDDKLVEQIINDNMNKHVSITFSNDQFHHPIKTEVEQSYIRDTRGLKIQYKGEMKEEKIYKTGFATIGSDFEYALEPLKYHKVSDDEYSQYGYIYVTANGYYTTEGMGAYLDMDRINCGHVSEMSIMDLIINYGEEMFKKSTKTL